MSSESEKCVLCKHAEHALTDTQLRVNTGSCDTRGHSKDIVCFPPLQSLSHAGHTQLIPLLGFLNLCSIAILSIDSVTYQLCDPGQVS